MFEGAMESMEVTGGLKIFIDKKSFIIVKQEINYDMMMDAIAEVRTIHESVHIFTELNKIDEIVIPNDVIDNAKTIPGL